MKELIDSAFKSPLKIGFLLVCFAFFVGVASPAFLEYLESQNISVIQEASARSIKNEAEISGVKNRLEGMDKKLDNIYLILINKK